MYKGINEFQKGYQPRTSVIKKDDDAIEADKTSKLSRSEQFCSNLLNKSTGLKGTEITLVIVVQLHLKTRHPRSRSFRSRT